MKIDSGCSIYIKLGSRKIKLPVNPEEIEIKRPTDHNTYHTLGKGEIVVQRRPSLQAASWDGFFPDAAAPYVNSGAKSPGDYVNDFEKAMKSRQKCRLIITRDGQFDTNLRCIISSFTTKDKGGEPGDIYYSIELMEYRDYAPETVMVIAETAQGGGQAEISSEGERAVETPVLRVGASVIANGKYWYDSNGSKPFGTANNLSTSVTRIVSGRPYPVHIGSYGWLSESQLQIVG